MGGLEGGWGGPVEARMGSISVRRGRILKRKVFSEPGRWDYSKYEVHSKKFSKTKKFFFWTCFFFLIFFEKKFFFIKYVKSWVEGVRWVGRRGVVGARRRQGWARSRSVGVGF